MALKIGEGNSAIVSGQRVATDVNSNRRIPQYVNVFLELNKDVAPLMVILDRTGRIKPVGQNSFFHFEEDDLPQVVETNGTQTSGDTSIEVTTGHGVRVRARDVLYCPRTDEQMTVTSVATDTLTVVRGHGGTTAAALEDDEDLQILASTFADGSGAPDSLTSEPTRVLNYLQIEKESVDLSGRNLETDNYGPEEKARTHKLATRRLMMKEEKSLLFGRLDDGTAGATRVTTGGVYHWVTTNITNPAGPLPESSLNTWIKTLYRRNQGNNLMCFMGSTVMDAIDGFGRDMIEYRPNDTIGGIAIGRYRNSHGELAFVKHGMLTEVFDDSATWPGVAIALNMDNVKKASWKNRSMMYKPNIQTPDVDGVKDQWIDDFGLYLGNEKSHGILKGVTG